MARFVTVAVVTFRLVGPVVKSKNAHKLKALGSRFCWELAGPKQG